MSLSTVSQLHSDLRQLAAGHPQDFSNDGMVNAFNSNLQIAKAEYPENAELTAMFNAKKQARVQELFVMTGQLKAVLESKQPISFGVV